MRATRTKPHNPGKSRLPKATRAQLHERFASWLVDNAGALAELDEIAGWHLELAVRYRCELGGELDPAVSQRAAAHLHAAGWRASERSDVAASRSLYERALKLSSSRQRPNRSMHAQRWICS